MSSPRMNPAPSTLLSRPVSPNLHLITGLAGIIFLLFLTWFHKQPPVFDEPYFVENVKLFEEHGLTREFLVSMQDQAPGPLYEFVHILFKPLTGLETPGIRLVNVFLLALTIILLSLILQQLQKIRFYEALVWSTGLVAVPMVWQVAGMALTEMPAMFFSMLGVYLLIRTLGFEKTSPVKSSVLSILGGLAMGLAILGRSPFLLIPLCLPVLLVDNWKNGARWRTVLIFISVAFAISIPVFMIWGGLVPPQQAGIGEGMSLWHGILAFAYAALFTVLLAPHWLYFNKKLLIGLILTYFIFLAINFFITRYEYVPLNHTLEKIFPSYFMKEIYPMLISPLLATVSFYFIGCCLLRAWQHREDKIFIVLLLCGLGLLASCFKITHLFSTRYVAQAAPFFLIVFKGYDRMTPARILRLLLGMAIGYFSLETYIHF